jgi:hypothetical protein
MKKMASQYIRRWYVFMNYFCLIVLNVFFYIAYLQSGCSHLVDLIGLSALAVTILTFIRVHLKTGLWRLTHSQSDRLDERELQITHDALSRCYGWFAVICLVIMLTHAVLDRLDWGPDFVITVPLVVSLMYLAHTLPGSFLAWSESEVPGDVS